jgi:hypothetical protein
MQDFNLQGVEHTAGGTALAAGSAGQHELHGGRGGDERDDDKLFESFAVLNDALLDAQSLPFESSEQLFDVPAHAVPADHRECLSNTLAPVCRQQAPQDRLPARHGINLAHFDSEQLDLGGSTRIRAVARSPDADGANAHSQFRPVGAAFPIRPCREIDLIAVHFRKGRHCRKQLAAASQSAIAAGAREQMGPRVGQARPFLIDIALAVIHDGDEASLTQHRLGLIAAMQPAVGFLLFNRKLLVVRSLRFGPAPHLGVNQPEAFPAFGINRQHRMYEQPDIAAIADRAETLLATALRLIVDLARVLNGEHMPAARRCRDKPPSMRHHLLNRHSVIVKKTPEPDLLRTIIPKFANADFLSFRHPLDQKVSHLSASVIPKIANAHFHQRGLPESRWSRQNHTGFSHAKWNRTAARLNRTATSVLKLAHKGRGRSASLDAIRVRGCDPSLGRNPSPQPSPTRGEGVRCRCLCGSI